MLLPLLLAATPTTFGIQIYTQSLTPPESLPLGGYTERGDKIGEPGQDLFSRAVIISQNNQQIAIVAFEGLTVPESLHREVQRRLDIPVFLVATHTHSAPDTQMLNERMTLRIPGIASFKRQWLDWYALRIAGGISKAQQSPKHYNNLTYAGVLTPLARSRRPQEPVSNHLKSINPIISVFGAHATALEADNLKTHGDWPGEFMRLSGILMLPGAIGNASPNFDQAQGEQKAKGIAEQLNYYRTASSPGSLVGTGLGFATEPIRLDPVKPHPDFARDMKVNDALAQIAVTKFAPTKAKLTVATIGRVALIGVPGEPTEDVARQLTATAEHAGYWGIVVSHCNGWIGYILDREDYARGGYEATLSFHGPGTADRLKESAERLFAKLSSSAKAAYSIQK